MPRTDGPTETVDRMVWRGIMAAFLQDETRLIDLEGAFRSSKATACLRKVAKACLGRFAQLLRSRGVNGGSIEQWDNTGKNRQ